MIPATRMEVAKPKETPPPAIRRRPAKPSPSKMSTAPSRQKKVIRGSSSPSRRASYIAG